MSSFSTLDAWCESSKTISHDKAREWNPNNQLRKYVSFDDEIQAKSNHHSYPILWNNNPCTIHVQDNRASIYERISTKFNTGHDKEVSSVSTTGIPTTSEMSIISIFVETPTGAPLGAKTCTTPQLAAIEPLIGNANGATKILPESATASDYNPSTTNNLPEISQHLIVDLSLPQRCQINGPQEQHKDNPETHMITRSKL